MLHVDDARGEMLLGSPGRDTLQLLSRRPRLAPERLQHLLALARERGFAVDRLQYPDAR